MDIYEENVGELPNFLNEWASRTWVTAERIIGEKYNKMWIVFLSLNVYMHIRIFYNSEFIYFVDPLNYLKINNYDINDDIVIIDCIMNTKVLYVEDKIFGILQHTKYKNQKDYNKIFDNLIIVEYLLEILENKGKIYFLFNLLNIKNLYTFKNSTFEQLKMKIKMKYRSTILIITENHNFKTQDKYCKSKEIYIYLFKSIIHNRNVVYYLKCTSEYDISLVFENKLKFEGIEYCETNIFENDKSSFKQTLNFRLDIHDFLYKISNVYGENLEYKLKNILKIEF